MIGKPASRYVFWLSLTLAAAASSAIARSPPPAPAPAAATPDTMSREGKVAREIASKPLRDVGLSKIEVPQVLADAAAAPYSLAGIRTCQQIAAAVSALNTALGPDLDAPKVAVNRTEALAEAGGKAVVGSIIPFGSLVREVSGAGSAERRLQAAIVAGAARRGFLRGVHAARSCKTRF